MRVKPGLSATKVLVSLGIVVSSTFVPAGNAYACQAGQPGCVLPVRDPPPPPPPPPGPPPPVIVEEEGGFGLGLWPILLALAAIAAAVYFLVLDDDDEDGDPISP